MTAQAHEQLILDGEWVSMTTCPALPENHPALRQADDSRPRPALSDDEQLARSTACWRRYLATWEIRAGHLYLRHVVGRYRLETAAPIPADWVTDTLRVPRGRVLRYVHMGFETVYERELRIRVVAGVVVDREVIDCRNRPDAFE